MKIKLGLGVFILPPLLLLSGAKVYALLSMAAAVLAHEAGHAIAALALKRKIAAITIEPFGARLVLSGGIPYAHELLIAISGPAASLLLFLCLSGSADGIADCSVFLCIINLLPVATLDGGRVLDCAVSYFFGPNAGARALKIGGRLCIFALWLLSVYLVLRYDGGFGLFAYSCILTALAAKDGVF